MSFYKQLELKTNRTSFLYGKRSGHPYTEHITYRHQIGQNVGHPYTEHITYRHQIGQNVGHPYTEHITYRHQIGQNVAYHYAQTYKKKNTTLLQTIGDLKKMNIVFMQKSSRTSRHKPSNKQLGSITIRTSFLCTDRSRHHNTELRK